MIRTFSADGAWCWFQDPRAVYIQGKFKKTYAQWITHDGKLQVGSIEHDSGKIEISTIKENWDRDDHNVGSFLVLPDNRIMIFYARHNKKGLYSCITQDPEDITKWDKEITVSSMNRVTYSHPVYLQSEKMFYVFWRGESWKPTFATSLDGIHWTDAKILIQDTDREKKNIRPYFKVFSDNIDTIHLIFTDGHPHDEPNNSVYYIQYKNHKFYKANGIVIGNDSELPIPHQKSDIVYRGNTNEGRAWVWDITSNNPDDIRILFTKYPTETDHRCCLATWNSSTQSWDLEEIKSVGKWFPQTGFLKRESQPFYSTGACFNSQNPNQIFLVNTNQNTYELLVAEKKNNSWGFVKLHQSPEIIARPISPKGNFDGLQILWMEGGYKLYTKFSTKIKMLDDDF